MRPYLHHVRVFAEWAIRRPMSSSVGVLMLLTGALVCSLVELEGERVLEALGGVYSLLVFGAAIAMFGVIAGAMGGPTRGGFQLAGHDPAMPALPLAPFPRVLAEVAGLLVVWLPVMVGICALGLALPEGDNTVAGELHKLAGSAGSNLVLAVFTLLPSLVVGRRTTAMGTPAAFGPMILATIATAPLGPLLLFAPWAVAPVSLALTLLGALTTPRSEVAMERLIERGSALTPQLRSAQCPWHTQAGAMLRRAVVSVLPGLVVLAAFYWMIDLGDSVEEAGPTMLFTTWLFPLLLVVAAPAFLPLGLDGRTAAPGGRSVPFDGSFREAWRLLPVEPVAVRRAALRQASIGGGLMVALGGVLAWLGSQSGLEVGEGSTMALLALGVLAATPLLAVMSLGTANQRSLATLTGALLMGAVIGHILLRLIFDDHALIQGLPTLLVVASAGVSAWLVATMLRPSKDEVGGASQPV